MSDKDNAELLAALGALLAQGGKGPAEKKEDVDEGKLLMERLAQLEREANGL